MTITIEERTKRERLVLRRALHQYMNFCVSASTNSRLDPVVAEEYKLDAAIADVIRRACCDA